uniref:Uncharacterized protein n=1 Tax=Globisporangium ultimum (strain ATCC 200006 / CBS 805.95 / DAOM BR144) TaxID=431595 RepID=K3WZV0_GLOUD
MPCPKERLKAQTREAEAIGPQCGNDALAKSTATPRSWCPKERFKAQKQEADKSGTPGSDSELAKL